VSEQAACRRLACSGVGLAWRASVQIAKDNVPLLTYRLFSDFH